MGFSDCQRLACSSCSLLQPYFETHLPLWESQGCATKNSCVEEPPKVNNKVKSLRVKPPPLPPCQHPAKPWPCGNVWAKEVVMIFFVWFLFYPLSIHSLLYKKATASPNTMLCILFYFKDISTCKDYFFCHLFHLSHHPQLTESPYLLALP